MNITVTHGLLGSFGVQASAILRCLFTAMRGHVTVSDHQEACGTLMCAHGSAVAGPSKSGSHHVLSMQALSVLDVLPTTEKHDTH